MENQTIPNCADELEYILVKLKLYKATEENLSTQINAMNEGKLVM